MVWRTDVATESKGNLYLGVGGVVIAIVALNALLVVRAPTIETSEQGVAQTYIETRLRL